MEIPNEAIIAVVGAGAMGSGIAQIAATSGHRVMIVDVTAESLGRSRAIIEKSLKRQVEKSSLSEESATAIRERLNFTLSADPSHVVALSQARLVIEAVVEDLKIKQDIFQRLEQVASDSAVLATNTSSLSVTAIAAACKQPQRVLGLHFFNPAPLMPLVEVVPTLLTHEAAVKSCRGLVERWGKITVLAKDTPGFIVNRVARPFYGEALRLLEEGIADVATIDWAMRELGGFRMGPFELMDFIGNDVNYKVSEAVFEACFFDPRYKPSIIQRRLVESKRLGRKSGRGFYDYREGAPLPMPQKDKKRGQEIMMRILVMLINEAAEAVHYGISSVKDVDIAMIKGVNYPKGLLAWADEIGIESIVKRLKSLYDEYHEDRYRLSPLLLRLKREGINFQGLLAKDAS